MYFPYLRNMQSEMLALRELCKKLHKNDHIIPIIEPITGFTYTKGTLKEVIKQNLKFILIENPINGDYKYNNKEIKTKWIHLFLQL